MRGRRFGTGFTLIELLVCISIVAVLAALLFPVFSRAKHKAKAEAARSAMRQLGLAAKLYSTGSDDIYPAALGANCYALIHKTSRYCGSWSLADGAEIPSFYDSARPFVADRALYISSVDRLDPTLFAEGGHSATWWEETKFASQPGSSFEYSFWKSFGTSIPDKSRPAVLLYSLYAEDWNVSKPQQLYSVVRTDLSLSKLRNVELGKEITP